MIVIKDLTALAGVLDDSKIEHSEIWAYARRNSSRWAEGIILFWSISRTATARDHVAGRTRLINPRGCRMVTITKHLLCTRGFHLFLLHGRYHNRHLLPSRFIHVSFFTFTCCYSKISCSNRHLGSTLPTSLSSFNSTATDGLFLRIFLSFCLWSFLPLSHFFFFLHSRLAFILYRGRFPSSSHLLRSTPRLRGLYPASTSTSSSSSSWLSPRSNRMLALAWDFFQKIQLRRSFMGVQPLATPECASLQLAHLWHAYSIFEARRWSDGRPCL